MTWPPVFPKSKLYELDIRVKEIDKSWPIGKEVPSGGQNGLVHKKEERKENKPVSEIKEDEGKSQVSTSVQNSEQKNEKVSFYKKFLGLRSRGSWVLKISINPGIHRRFC